MGCCTFEFSHYQVSWGVIEGTHIRDLQARGSIGNNAVHLHVAPCTVCHRMTFLISDSTFIGKQHIYMSFDGRQNRESRVRIPDWIALFTVKRKNIDYIFFDVRVVDISKSSLSTIMGNAWFDPCFHGVGVW